MRIITCASYYGTGSSAVTDLFSEFTDCASFGEHEFRFIHDPDGIRDLEYNIVENNNRHNTSNAIKRFIKFTKQFNGSIFRKGYKRYMGKNFMIYTKEYINKIVELKCESWWFYDRIEKGKLFYFIDTAIERFSHKIFKTYSVSLMNLLHEKAYFSAISREEFYKYTRKYVNKIVESMNIEQKKFVMVDQLLPPSNLNSYLPYFYDIRVIVVDRDPRDIFLLEKIVWKGRVVPNKTVQDFCKWYELTRRHRKTEVYDKDKVYLLQFEDLIYKYDETVLKLMEFVGLTYNEHLYPKSKFDPKVSINNTNLKNRYPQYKEEIAYIEKELKQYLYPFPDKDFNEDNMARCF